MSRIKDKRIEPGIYEMPPGSQYRYRVQYSERHPVTRESKNLRRYARTLAEARRTRVELVGLVKDGIRKAVTPAWPLVIDAYIADLNERGCTIRHGENAKYLLDAHTREQWSSRFVDSIVGSDIRDLINQRVGTKSESTKATLFKFIKGAFDHALEKRWIRSSPMPRMRFKMGDKVLSVLVRDQAAILLKRAREDGLEWYPVWAMALYTGMRSGELYAVRWQNVDLATKKIKVVGTWDMRRGEVKSFTKSYNQRIVPINSELGAVLAQLMLTREGGEFVFPRNPKWAKGEQARELRKYLIGYGLPQVRFHDLRASWATMLLASGRSPAEVMKMGGWADLKTMMMYMRLSGIDTEGATDGLRLHDPNPMAAKVLKFEGQAPSQ